MAAMSDFLENKLVDHIFRGVTYTVPTTLYVALYTSAPSDSGAGIEVPIGTNAYARKEVISTAGSPVWANTQGVAGTATSSGTSGVTSNTSAITFIIPSGSWGTVTHFGILDAATGGNLLFHGALTVSQTVNTGNTVSFAAGALQITFA
jgi:hypothetical protein